MRKKKRLRRMLGHTRFCKQNTPWRNFSFFRALRPCDQDSPISVWKPSLRSMAVLSSRAQERRSREIRAKRARTSGEAARKIASAPISSRFLCPRPPLLLSAPDQNRHATQANGNQSTSFERSCTHEWWATEGDSTPDSFVYWKGKHTFLGKKAL